MSRKIKKVKKAIIKKAPEVKQKECEVKKYLTKNVEIEISSDFQVIEEFSKIGVNQNVFLKANYKPQEKMVLLTNISGLTTQEITLMQLRALAKSFNDLALTIERQEKLRELAEGFGEAMEEVRKVLTK